MKPFSNPFKRRSTLHRWKFTNGMNGTTIKTLQYYHRKARKWLDCKDENGCKVTSILEGR